MSSGSTLKSQRPADGTGIESRLGHASAQMGVPPTYDSTLTQVYASIEPWTVLSNEKGTIMLLLRTGMLVKGYETCPVLC